MEGDSLLPASVDATLRAHAGRTRDDRHERRASLLPPPRGCNATPGSSQRQRPVPIRPSERRSDVAPTWRRLVAMSSNEPRVPRSLLPLHVVALASPAVAAVFVVLPFLPWIVLALWTSGLAIGLREPVVRITGGRRRAAAAIALLLVLAFLVPLAFTIVPFAIDGMALVRRLLAAPDTRRMLESLVSDGGAGRACRSVALGRRALRR